MKQSKSTARAVSGQLIAFSALGAYFAVLFVGGILNADKLSVISPNFIIYLHPLYYALAWLGVSAVLLLYGSISKRFVYAFCWLAAMCYSLFCAVSGGSDYLAYAMCGVMALMTVLCGRAMRGEPAAKRSRFDKEISVLGGKVAVGAVVALVGGGVLLLAVSSYLSYTTMPSASTGVYVQLMESLRTGRFFDTSMEFGEIGSHFGAHISPIFLVYLPFYAILPSAVTLIVLQTAAVYSAVVPLWLIARRRGLSAGVSGVLCALLCLYPAVWGGTAGMLHEYALLLPLLLWLFWALEARRSVLVWVFAALTLCVRETAAIHLLSIGLYWLIQNRRSAEAGESLAGERKKALILAGGSAIYFIGAIVLLSTLGRGTLITRFANVTGEYGFFIDTLLRDIFYNPALILYEMLNEQKLLYVLGMLLPLCFLPLLSKKKAGLVFLFPFLFLNLLADFSYHYNPDFPYSFGMAAIFFYLSVISLSARAKRPSGAPRCRRILALALSFTLIICAFSLVDDGLFIDYAVSGRQEVVTLDDLLLDIDPDASVSASARLCPNLAARREIYTLSQRVETDIVVIDLRDEWQIGAEETYDVEYYTDMGYTVVAERAGVGVVLRRE